LPATLLQGASTDTAELNEQWIDRDKPRPEALFPKTPFGNIPRAERGVEAGAGLQLRLKRELPPGNHPPLE